VKPHPRPAIIRKTVKWASTAAVGLFAAMWVMSTWRFVEAFGPNGTTVGLSAGRVYASSSVAIAVPMHWEILTGPSVNRGLGMSAPFEWKRFMPGEWWLTAPLWSLIAPTALVAALAWRLDLLARRRRAKLNFCSKCHYDRTGIAAGIACPECGTIPNPIAGPIAPFPYFVLIGDEQCFMRCDNQRELNHFEQMDIEDLVHWAWDIKGSKYRLVWDKKIGAHPELVAVDGIADFRAALDEYRKRLATAGSRGGARDRCDPDALLAVLRTMDAPGSGRAPEPRPM